MEFCPNSAPPLYCQFAETVAANLSDEDLDDFCTVSGNNTVGRALRMFANHDAVITESSRVRVQNTCVESDAECATEAATLDASALGVPRLQWHVTSVYAVPYTTALLVKRFCQAVGQAAAAFEVHRSVYYIGSSMSSCRPHCQAGILLAAPCGPTGSDPPLMMLSKPFGPKQVYSMS
jgi:hypothetical protein